MRRADAVLSAWLVPYEEGDVDPDVGVTHAIVS